MDSIFAGFGNIFNEINITTLVHFFFLNWIAITVKTTGVLGTFSPEKAVVNLFMSMYNNVTNANKRVVENQWKAFPKTSIKFEKCFKPIFYFPEIHQLPASE